MADSLDCPRFTGFGLLAVAILVAGCLQSPTSTNGKTTDSPSTGISDPHAFLDALQTPVKPEGKRALDDLETFVALAPRRYENQFQHEAARDWLESQFKDAGLQVVRQNFTGKSQVGGLGGVPTPPVPGQNIVGILPGKDPDRLLVFGAHYDSAISAYGAAYDDGSGTLVVLELARAMAAYDWTHTLVFAEFDQEESGLVGSAFAAQEFLDEGKQVDLMVNFDMAGINWPAKLGGATEVPVTAAFGGDSNETAELWKAMVSHRGDPEASSTVTTGATSGPSDHGSFLAADMPAVWVHGGLIGSYPLYHNGDQVPTMVAMVGGDRAALEAGFDTILQRTFLFTFLVDHAAGPAAPMT